MLFKHIQKSKHNTHYYILLFILLHGIFGSKSVFMILFNAFTANVSPLMTKTVVVQTLNGSESIKRVC